MSDNSTEAEPNLTKAGWNHLVGEFLGPEPQPNYQDWILFQATLFNQDTNPDKVSLAIGYAKDRLGNIFRPVAIHKTIEELEAEGTLFKQQGYVAQSGPLGWSGEPDFMYESARNLFGEQFNQLYAENCIAAVATIGATQAVAIVADVFKNNPHGDNPPTVLMGSPPYPNHPYVFSNHGLDTISYYHHIKEDGTFNLEATLEAFSDPQITNESTLVVLQGESHNPTGVNARTREEWVQMAQAIKKSGATVYFDLAYAGFDKGMMEDMEPARIFMSLGVPVFVSLSYSKNGGVYDPRVGVLFSLCPSEPYARKVTTAFNAVVRHQTSSSAGPGQRVIGRALSNPEHREEWLQENLPEEVALIIGNKETFASKMPRNAGGVIRSTKGMFSVLEVADATAAEEYLRTQENVYAVPVDQTHLRINSAGVTPEQMKKIAAPALRRSLNRYPPPKRSRS